MRTVHNWRIGRTALAALIALASSAACSAPAPAATATPDRRIELVAERTPWSRMWAEPSGAVTVESFLVPQWVRQADGMWADIDTTLRQKNGALAPAATLADVRFSNGGTGPAATLRRAGHEFSLSWPEPLPTPKVDGGSATYSEVLPGVDLVMRSTRTGFSHLLVIKDRAAGAQARARQIRMPIGGDAMVVATPDGGLRVAAGDQVLATAGGASMWDSGQRMGKVAAEVTSGDLVLTPDIDLLESGTYPVFVDPDFSTAETAFAYSTSNNSNHWPYPDPNPKTGDLGGNQLRAGRNPVQGINYRGFLQFPTVAGGHDLRGRHILNAKLLGTVDHTWKCNGSRELKFYRSAAIAATPRQAWPGPTLYVALPSIYVGANEDNCSESNKPFEVVLTGDMQSVANANLTTYTVAVVAANEGNTEYWFRLFLDSFFLTVTYNSAPTAPTNLAVEGAACGSFVPSTTPGLRAHLFDPDGDTDLTLQYAWDRWNPATSAWDRIGDFYKTGQRSGDDPVLRVGLDAGTAALEHGKRYRFTTAALDPWTYAGSSGTDYSGWAPWCEFEVDTVRPNAVPVISSPIYTEYRPGVDEDYHGGVGLTGQFTFGPADVSDVAGYHWGWNDPPLTFVATPAIGGSVTLDLTPIPPFPKFPTRSGTLTLYVRSVDRAGQLSDSRVYPIRVASAPGPLAQWLLDDAAGAASLVDSSGNNRTASASNVTTGTPGRLLSGPGQAAPTVALFNGTNSYATTGTQIMNTTRSFSVAVWICPDANSNGWRAILSATGGDASAFFLRRDPDNRFHFTLVAGSTWAQAVSATTSTPGKWMHLLAVYDAGSRQAHLYVNGVRESTADIPSVYNATGAFEIGRSWWANSWGYHPNWHGAMAEVKLWQRVVSAPEAAPMAGRIAASWSLDGNGGDASGWGHDVTAQGGVSWGAGKTAQASILDGVTGQLVTAGPVVRTDQSFTVAAWVRPDANSNGYRSVVAADGDYNSAFFLRRTPDNRWAFTWVSDGQPMGEVVGTSTSLAGTWVHVAVAYDAAKKQALLYVNGQLQATGVVVGILASGRPLIIGHDRWVGNPNFHNPWHGAIDDVRVYAGALPVGEIAKLYQP